jgi:DNA mismatch repair ATPase MutS
MLAHSTIRRFMSLFIASSLMLSTTIHAAQQPVSIYKKIANHALSSADLFPSLHNARTIRDVVSPKLSQGNKNAAVLGLFEEADDVMRSASFITEDGWRELELFARDSSDPVFDKISADTLTTQGKWTLADLLVNDAPSKDPKKKIEEYKRRQNIVKKLVEDEALYAKLHEALKSIQPIESLFLVFFLNENAPRQDLLNRFYTDKSTQGAINAIQEVVKLLGSSEEESAEDSKMLLNFVDRSPNFLLSINTFYLFLVFMSMRHLYNSVQSNGRGVLDLYNAAMNKPSWNPLPSVSMPTISRPSLDTIKQLPGKLKSALPSPASINAGDVAWGTCAAVGTPVIGALRAFWNATGSLDHITGLLHSSYELPKSPFKIYNEFKLMVDVQDALQRDLMKLSSALEHLRTISKQVIQTTDLVELMPESSEFFNIFNKNDAHSEYMNDLLTMLDSETFKGDPSLFSHWGRVLAANSLMGATKSEWGDLFKAIGYIDAYMSLATLIKDSRKHKEINPSAPGYCFVEYVMSDKPYLSMTNFYDPQIDPSRVVTNNLELGGDKMRNIFISGPNMGGKSTFIKGLGINLLLMRLGIAAADAMKVGPVSKINICRYVKEDTRDNLSNFGKEASVGAYLINQARAVSTDEFSITLLDEFLKGSIRQVNTRAAEVFSEKIGSVPNSMCVYITHNLDLVSSPQLVSGVAPLFGNYSMELLNTPDGAFKQTYKLIEGPTTPEIMNKAGEMVLKQVGLLDK